MYALAIVAALCAADFETDVAPLLLRRCVECHHSGNPSGGLDLTSFEAARRGGDSGPALVSGQLAESYLWERVEKGEMPPAHQGKSRRLADAERQLLGEWITSGARWPAGRKLDLFERTSEQRGGRDWWAFQPLRLVAPPLLEDRSHSRTAIDLFIQQTLRRAEREPAPEAERTQLLRRLFVDLTGLSPSGEELDQFAADAAPDAYERQVDRLLASPRFGERWARYWLDLARFADTSGYERDQEKPFAWKYRDWVIQSLNEDLPYDQFVKAQLAGDELDGRTERELVATGFLRLGTWNDEPNDPQEYKYERLEDLVHAASTAFLGLTTKCARCHDHKFDPIPQRDYYRMAAAFWPGPIEPRGRELLGGPTRDELGADVLGWTDVSPSPPPLKLLRKGDPHRPADEVPPGGLSLLPQLDQPFAPPPAGSRTTLRRRQLADWIVDARNPLTPRLAVNRLWLHHMGQGLVRTPDNFGFTGAKPTHPELLDWLAGELQRGQWRLKPLHRQIVTSHVYRQSSVHPQQTAYSQADHANHTWWRGERRRLDAELLRDAMLTAAGRLDLRMGGPSFKPTISADALEGLSRKSGAWQPSPDSEQGRRSVYMYSQRSLLPPLLTTFDFVDTTLPCAQREVSTVAPQALALLNNEFAHQQSESFARRVAVEAGENDEQAVQVAWRIALGRQPSETELKAAVRHLQVQRANFLRFAERTIAAREPRESSANRLGPELPLKEQLVLWLDAERGVRSDASGAASEWEDQSGAGHHARQVDAARRPQLIPKAAFGRAVVRFEGKRQFMELAGQVVKSQQFTVLAVVADRGPAGHRELFSNWNGAAGNSGSSLFVGLTGVDAVRLSDDFSGVGRLERRESPFLLLAMSGARDAQIFQNRRHVASKGAPLSTRDLGHTYVVGQQGNIDGEYWAGDVAELLVFDGQLSDDQRTLLLDWYDRRYPGMMEKPAPPQPVDARRLALASLCHVLLNSNEFAYVD